MESCTQPFLDSLAPFVKPDAVPSVLGQASTSLSRPFNSSQTTDRGLAQGNDWRRPLHTWLLFGDEMATLLYFFEKAIWVLRCLDPFRPSNIQKSFWPSPRTLKYIFFKIDVQTTISWNQLQGFSPITPQFLLVFHPIHVNSEKFFSRGTAISATTSSLALSEKVRTATCRIALFVSPAFRQALISPGDTKRSALIAQFVAHTAPQHPFCLKPAHSFSPKDCFCLYPGGGSRAWNQSEDLAVAFAWVWRALESFLVFLWNKNLFRIRRKTIGGVSMNTRHCWGELMRHHERPYWSKLGIPATGDVFFDPTGTDVQRYQYYESKWLLEFLKVWKLHSLGLLPGISEKHGFHGRNHLASQTTVGLCPSPCGGSQTYDPIQKLDSGMFKSMSKLKSILAVCSGKTFHPIEGPILEYTRIQMFATGSGLSMIVSKWQKLKRRFDSGLLHWQRSRGFEVFVMQAFAD